MEIEPALSYIYCRLKTASHYILFLLLTISCNVDEPLVYNVDARLEKYVIKFFTEGEVRGHAIKPINLVISAKADLLKNENRLAVTRGSSSDRIIIEVDESLVAGSDSLFLEFAMMHEFGHGYLKREHCDYYSIMNPKRKSVHGYSRNKEERSKLLDELFENGTY